MRGISDAFLNDLKTGTLCGLTDAVKNSNDLIMCFRDGYLNVYYIGHSVFKVEEQARYKRYKVSFNLGHARYLKTFPEIKDELDSLGMEIEAKSYKDKSYAAIFYVDSYKKVDFPKIIEKYKEYIDDFFDQRPNKVDRFKNNDVSNRKLNLREKRHQQTYFMNYMELKNGSGFILYDMELSIPNVTGSPDCLGVEIQDNEIKSIVLVEVKSTYDACVNKNGVKKHKEDFTKIINNTACRGFIIESLKESLKNYAQLNLYKGIETVFVPETVDFKVKYVFTHEETKRFIEEEQDGLLPNENIDYCADKMKLQLREYYN